MREREWERGRHRRREREVKRGTRRGRETKAISHLVFVRSNSGRNVHLTQSA